MVDGNWTDNPAESGELLRDGLPLRKRIVEGELKDVRANISLVLRALDGKEIMDDIEMKSILRLATEKLDSITSRVGG